MRKLMHKRVLIPVLAIAALAFAGVAYAYFTSSGTGSGTASVGTDAGVTISPVTFDSTLFPGSSTAVHFTVNNTSADTSAKVDKVVADGAVTGLPAGCLAADFHFADVSVGATIAPGGTASGSGTLSMDNTAANQDACKGAAPVLHLKVDNSGI